MDEVIATTDTRMVDSFILTLDRNEDEENWKRDRESCMRERELCCVCCPYWDVWAAYYYLLSFIA